MKEGFKAGLAQGHESQEELGPVLTALRSQMKRKTPYREIIAEHGRRDDLASDNPQPYSESFRSWTVGAKTERDPGLQEDRAYLKEKLKDTIIVNLGASEDTSTAEMVRNTDLGYQAAAAIHVDRTYDEYGRENPLKFHKMDARSNECVRVRADMLDFISRLPDNSVNIVMNGIDASIIGLENDYTRALAKEIVRVMRQEGIITGHDFTAIRPELMKYARQGIVKHYPLGSNRYPRVEVFGKTGITSADGAHE